MFVLNSSYSHITMIKTMTKRYGHVLILERG